MLYRKPQDDPSGAAIDDLHVRRGEQKFLPASFSRYHGHFTAPRRLPNWTLAMPSAQKLDTHHKALTLNLDTSTFGSFAEIGTGQEVARWFLLVGGTAGTVAKTISAYDKEVSDDLYGSGARYLSKQRLGAMLDNQWTKLLTQLSKTRGPQSRFFYFVDTVSALTSPEPTNHMAGSVPGFSEESDMQVRKCDSRATKIGPRR
jgi:hypothetical protein